MTKRAMAKNTKEGALQSWMLALREAQFANCIRYLLGAVNGSHEGKQKVVWV